MGVAQAFQPAGSRNFPVPWLKRDFGWPGDWKAARTSRLESLLYLFSELKRSSLLADNWIE